MGHVMDRAHGSARNRGPHVSESWSHPTRQRQVETFSKLAFTAKS